MHGNTIKLLFLLIKHGLATELKEQEYKELISIYITTTDALTHENLQQFNLLLAKIKFNKGATIRLIGDELADRGYNDYFTLKLLEKLHEQHVDLEILLSNHGIEFIEAYETQMAFHPLRLSKEQHACSMEKMQTLIDKGLISKDEIIEIAQKCYKPTLKVLSYTLNEDRSEITLYSHSAIGLNTIYYLTQRLGLPYEDATAIVLAQTIDAINVQFQEFVRTNRVHELYTDNEMWRGYGGSTDITSPFEFIMWNRMYDHIDRPPIHHGYAINYVHGHDMGEITNNNIYNLDNFLGKGASANQGQYSVLYSHETSLKQHHHQEASSINEDTQESPVTAPPIEKVTPVPLPQGDRKLMFFHDAPHPANYFGDGERMMPIC